MKFVIGTSNVKIFAKSILALSKIGEEIYVEPLQDSVSEILHQFRIYLNSHSQ